MFNIASLTGFVYGSSGTIRVITFGKNQCQNIEAFQVAIQGVRNLPGIMTLTLSGMNLTLSQINKETSFLLRQINGLS